jgi:hypothetical protein
VNTSIRRKLADSKRRIQRRLDRADLGDCSKPMMTAGNIHYEIAERSRTDGEVAERTAKTCLLVPDAVADLAPVLRLADRAVTGTEKSGNYRFFLFCKGLAEYRGGRNAEAVDWGERSAPDAEGSNLGATAFAVLAMAQHRLGRVRPAVRQRLGRLAALPDPARRGAETK